MSKLFEKSPSHIQKLYSNRTKSVRSVGKLGSGMRDIKYVGGIALDDSRNIYIADNGNMRIQVFTFNGCFITNFGRELLLAPYAICVKNNIAVVSDNVLKGVVRFNGCECSKVVVSDAREIKMPMGLTIDQNCDIYVADAFRSTIAILNDDLRITREMGKDKLQKPRDVKIREDKVIVCDNNLDYNVHIFNKAGELLKSIIKLKKANGPLFICLDRFDNIAVSDTKNREITIATIKGKLIHHWFTSGRPTGIEITKDGIIVRANYDFAQVYIH